VPLTDLLSNRSSFPIDPPPLRAEAANEGLVRDLVTEVVRYGNIAVAEHVLAPNFTFHGLLGNMNLSRSQLIRAIERLRAAFPNLALSIDDLVATRDTVVVRWTLQGAHQGEVAGVAPTGILLTHTGVAIFRIADNRVSESWMVAESDATPLLRRLGLTPSPVGEPAPGETSRDAG
jgi:predicted ester cyclase